MEVKPGYKQTEVGLIPEDWEVNQLKHLTKDMLQGVNTAIDIPEYVEDGIPMLKANNIIDKEVRFDNADHVSLKIYDGYSERYKLQRNDFLFSNIGARLGTGSLLRVDTKCTFAWNVMRIIPNQEKIEPDFLHHLMNSNILLKQIKMSETGSGMGFVPKSVVKDTWLPLSPTKEEQTAIATALSDADALIQSLERLIAKKRDIKQGAMQELLTGKKRLPGFEKTKGYQQTEVGVIPEDWGVVPMGSLGTFSKGHGISKDESDSGEIPCIRYGEIYTHHNDIIHLYNSFISLEVAKSSKKLKTGDILFAGSGETKEEIGKCVAFIDAIKAYAGGDIVILTPNKGKPQFFGYLFNAPIISRQKASKGQGDAVVHISSSALSSIRVPLPPTHTEQSAIATIISDMEAEIAALESKLAKARQIKQGMMQELLTGRIRLT